MDRKELKNKIVNLFCETFVKYPDDADHYEHWREHIADEFIAAGLGDVRAAVKEVLDKVYNAVENARLESEFQDEKGTWLMDEYEFMSEFTLGKLHELYKEYKIELDGDTEQMKNDKGDVLRKKNIAEIFSWIYKNLVNMNFITGNVEISLSALDTFAKTYGVEIFDIFKQGGNNEHKL